MQAREYIFLCKGMHLNFRIVLFFYTQILEVYFNSVLVIHVFFFVCLFSGQGFSEIYALKPYDNNRFI